MKPKGRTLARQYALQGMYQWQLTHALSKDIEMEFLTYQSLNKKVDIEYFKELINEVPKRHAEIDETMIPFLKRPLQELDPIELAVLRISIYELTFRLDIPYRVIINEALELTKKFGSVEGYKFVNGVLDHIARKIRSVEINMR